MSERIGFWLLVRLARWWAENHMDQWEHVVFASKVGPVYLSLTMETPWPDSFDQYPLAQPKLGGEDKP